MRVLSSFVNWEARKIQVQRQVNGLIPVSAARAAIAGGILAVAACGGNSNGPPLNLSGTISGLTTSGLSLTTLGVNLVISEGATSFNFGPILYNGVVYDVSVPDQPAGQLCTVANGTGTATTANISNVVVTCSNKTFTVGGTLSGLTSSGLVLANGSDSLAVAAGATSFTLPAGVAYGSDYSVTVAAQPAGLTCDVTDGSGTMGDAAVTSVTVKCTADTPAVSGTIRGLERATGLVLANGASTYAVPEGATSFRFDPTQSAGDSYAVRVQAQPGGMTCSVSDGTGTVPTHDVSDVSVTCSDEAYTLGGSVTGLTAAGLVLSDGADSYAVPVDATHFSFPTAIASGASYALSIQAQPAGLTCTISGGGGVMHDESTAAVTCASTGYTLGGTISGLTSSGLVLTDGTDDLSVSSNAAQFSMPNALAAGSAYNVTIKAQPRSARCEISGGSGVIDAEVTTVRIACEASPSPL
jgi:hypothetical protein